MSFFEELKNKVHSDGNSNFHFDKLEWTTRVWIKEMCDLIDEKQLNEDGLDLCSCGADHTYIDFPTHNVRCVECLGLKIEEQP